MSDLSAEERELLSQDLPDVSRIEVASPLYVGGHGKVAYRAEGNRARPAVLLLHGLGSSSAGYRAQLAGLARDFRVIAWNAPGFGESTPIAVADPHAEHYADVAAALLRALGVGRVAALIGSSWGSVIATAFAVRHPDLLGNLVLSAPNVARGNLDTASRAAELNAVLGSAEANLSAPRSDVADRLLTPRTPRLIRHHVERLRDATTLTGWQQAMTTLFSVYAPAVIGDVQCPVALLAGTDDQVAPYREHALRLHAALPSAEVHLFEGFGHMLKLEAALRFNSIVHAMAS